MKVSDLPWDPHPVFPNGEQAKFFGFSIIRGDFFFEGKYEVMDRNGDIHQFDTDEQLLGYLREKLPGCFIGEG